MEDRKTIDLKKAIRESNSRFLRSLPEFVIRWMERIIGQDEINEVINKNYEKSGVSFIKGVLNELGVNVESTGDENIPKEGRFIFAANHPVGGLDAVSIFTIIDKFFPVIVSPANELLKIIPQVRPYVFGLNVFGKTNRETAKKLDELYESDVQIFIFPAGEVSRRQKGIISDLTWQKSFVTKAVQHKRDIIPLFIGGRNSNLFYFIANLRKKLGIKMYIETMLLPREMLKQRNSTVRIWIGKPIPYQTFTSEKTHSEWAQWVKSVTYSLPYN